MSRKRTAAKHGLSGLVALFFFLGFGLLALKRGTWESVIPAIAVPAVILLTSWLLPLLFPLDRLLLALVNSLSALGILVLYITDPSLALHQMAAYGIGLAAMLCAASFVRLHSRRDGWTWILGCLGLILLCLPVLFGQELYGARNWLNIGILSFQPSEIVKPVLVFCLAAWMAERRGLLCLLFAALCLLLLMLQKDLGTALLYFAVGLLVWWMASGSLSVLAAGLLGGGAAALWGYHHFAHVRRRVEIWIDPWKDYQNAGYQLVQSLVAIASGGLFGVGLGLGAPDSIPIHTSDFIFSAICEQFVLIFGACVLFVYALLIWRSASVARAARYRFHGLLAMGSALFLGLQTFLIIGGVLKLIPLTGVTLPFVSYGGSNFMTNIVGIALVVNVVKSRSSTTQILFQTRQRTRRRKRNPVPDGSCI